MKWLGSGSKLERICGYGSKNYLFEFPALVATIPVMPRIRMNFFNGILQSYPLFMKTSLSRLFAEVFSLQLLTTPMMSNIHFLKNKFWKLHTVGTCNIFIKLNFWNNVLPFFVYQGPSMMRIWIRGVQDYRLTFNSKGKFSEGREGSFGHCVCPPSSPGRQGWACRRRGGSPAWPWPPWSCPHPARGTLAPPCHLVHIKHSERFLFFLKISWISRGFKL